ncbi:Cytochrome b561 and DOMON domain-containing protein [Hibiscus syriacus]|uniref:Cytochrome b561 and DOMON domain-containing protein n=1 Tax=Hibiscus syriacus TaxID=106335 RepID=A0A6A2Z6C0_HIBSY|nr:cytochrome b561 and DOMON domain-containing protein At4g17280-like [Hibiscus syriacus]KAE8686665.1 Cytochrome b561 and DOMON domain-containing protein [Hibiscus syriacus]
MRGTSTLLPLCLLMSLLLSSYAQTCSRYTFSSNRVFRSCSDLPVLNSFLHYNHDSSGKLEIAYRHTAIGSSRWVAWAINPTSKGMVGSQALVAYRRTDGTMRVYTSPITQYQTQLREGKLSFEVSDLSATYENNEITIFATLGLSNNGTTLNQVWQEGGLSGNTPQMHVTSGPNVQSMATLNLLSGETATTNGGGSKLRKRNIHGILNAVSWGILMPIGTITARYLKVFKSADPAWFYLHAACQFSSYVVGVAGWSTGLKLGSESPGIRFDTHRTIGIVLFSLGTLQVFALLLRPKPDHKYRLYWNIYHHLVGYAVIILSVINVFKGFDILKPDDKWKNAYIGVIVALAFCAVVLEAYTWFVVVKRKRSESAGKLQHGCGNGNGYGARSQQA